MVNNNVNLTLTIGRCSPASVPAADTSMAARAANRRAAVTPSRVPVLEAGVARLRVSSSATRPGVASPAWAARQNRLSARPCRMSPWSV